MVRCEYEVMTLWWPILFGASEDHVEEERYSRLSYEESAVKVITD